MSESLFDRLLSILQAAGPEGVKTDALAKLSGAKPLVLNNYLRRYRVAGIEIHTLRGSQCPGTLYTRREWFDAAKTARTAEVAARHKAQVAARSKAQSDLAAWRKATAAAAADAKAALLKPPRQARAKPAQHVGPLPDPHVLPSQPAYSRHQLTALPVGFESPLDPAECRPWAIAATRVCAVSDRRLFFLAHTEARKRAAEAVAEAPDGYRVCIEPPKRNGEQNAKFHAICSDIARSGIKWAGKPRSAAQWKVLLVSGHAVATEEGADMVPGLEGEYVNLRESTALMSVKRSSSLIEYAMAFAAQRETTA